MTSIFTLISNSSISRWFFGYSFSISSLAFIENKFMESDYFQNIINQMPSKIAVVLGVISGIAYCLGRISKEWKQHKLNIQDVKKGEELLEQEELRTEIKRKELESLNGKSST